MAFDLLVRNGTVIDGSGTPRYHADVGVRDMAELREFARDNDEELIRVVSSQASAVGQAYGNWM